jgi:GH43 family beta-xylosidase
MKNISNYRHIFLALTLLVTIHCGKGGSTPPPPPPAANTFTNPLRSGSDPWVIKKDGYFYYTQTVGDRITIWRTASMSALSAATALTVFTPIAGSANSANIWAPEIHFLSGKWYIYYTAGSGPDNTQRTWVLENGNADPMTGVWVDKGRIFSADADFWAIDGSVMEFNGSQYFVWSGRPNPSQQNQNIYIAKMVDPWTLMPTSTLISSPQLAWETNGGPVNEAPEHLMKAGKHFLVYSASGCWTDDYALGLLTLKTGGDPLIAADWTKSMQPVFSKRPQGNAYAPGHNAFFQSKDGTEDWIIYHANSNSNAGCAGSRTIRMQAFQWNGDNTPNFGIPVATAAAIRVPAGE